MRISTSTGYKRTGLFSPWLLWDLWEGSLRSKILLFQKDTHPCHLGLLGHFRSKVAETHFKWAHWICWGVIGHSFGTKMELNHWATREVGTRPRSARKTGSYSLSVSCESHMCSCLCFSPPTHLLCCPMHVMWWVEGDHHTVSEFTFPPFIEWSTDWSRLH